MSRKQTLFLCIKRGVDLIWCRKFVIFCEAIFDLFEHKKRNWKNTKFECRILTCLTEAQKMCLSFIIQECAAHDNNFHFFICFLRLHPLKHIIKRDDGDVSFAFLKQHRCDVLSSSGGSISGVVRRIVFVFPLLRIPTHGKMITEREEWKNRA